MMTQEDTKYGANHAACERYYILATLYFDDVMIRVGNVVAKAISATAAGNYAKVLNYGSP